MELKVGPFIGIWSFYYDMEKKKKKISRFGWPNKGKNLHMSSDESKRQNSLRIGLPGGGEEAMVVRRNLLWTVEHDLMHWRCSSIGLISLEGEENPPMEKSQKERRKLCSARQSSPKYCYCIVIRHEALKDKS